MVVVALCCSLYFLAEGGSKARVAARGHAHNAREGERNSFQSIGLLPCTLYLSKCNCIINSTVFPSFVLQSLQFPKCWLSEEHCVFVTEWQMSVFLVVDALELFLWTTSWTVSPRSRSRYPHTRLPNLEPKLVKCHRFQLVLFKFRRDALTLVSWASIHDDLWHNFRNLRLCSLVARHFFQYNAIKLISN